MEPRSELPELASVQAQYLRFPYPPIPFFALPSPHDGAALTHPSLGPAPRVLVLGCGTFEGLRAAASHPSAARITGIDLSERSIARLRLRTGLARLARHRLPPTEWIAADFLKPHPELAPAAFDLVIASNVLHHLPEPAEGLARAAALTKLGGWIRVVTYPRASRAWMRAASRFLRARGLSSNSPRLALLGARRLALSLPKGHPVREIILHHPERGTPTGIADAFLHALERPLSPRDWGLAACALGLRLQEQDWDQLDLLDGAWMLDRNPVLWLHKVVEPTGEALPRYREPAASLRGEVAHALGQIPSHAWPTLRAQRDSSAWGARYALTDYTDEELAQQSAVEFDEPAG